MNIYRFLATIIIGTSLCLLGYQPAFADDPVDCDDGDSIQEELDDGELLIEFTGTCMEDVDISASGVTLIGADAIPSFNVIKGNITITGAIGVELSNFTVDGTGLGPLIVLVEDGSFAKLNNMTLTETGLDVFKNSGAHLVAGSVVAPITDGAIEVRRHSFVRTDGTNISGNASGGPTVVAVAESSSFYGVSGSITKPAGGNAIFLKSNALANLDSVTVSGRVIVNHHSTLVIDSGSSVTAGGPFAIRARDDSSIIGGDNGTAGGVTVTGNVRCLDVESSLDDPFFFAISLSNSCTGF